jgi:hypothetical protein
MSSEKASKENKIANHIERLKDQVLSRWRDQVRRDPEQSAQIHNLDDKELEDHLPSLTDKSSRYFEANLFTTLKKTPPSTAASGGRWDIRSFHWCGNSRFFAAF